MAKVTIEDISRQTGLSRGTVSRALNDRPDISKQTKQRVLEACRKLNYAPSHAARSLATGRSFAVAVLVDDLQSVVATSFLRGVLACAPPAGYAVHVAELGTDPQQQSGTLRALVNERIDGVLVATPLAGELPAVLGESIERRPVVTCVPIEGISCDVLVPDQTEAGRLVARHLLRGGNREVMYVHAGGPYADERLAGFREVCIEYGLAPSDVVVGLPANAPLNPQTEHLILNRLSGIRAIAATDDFVAVNLMALCCRAGRNPGQDIAIMGQGNERISSRITPSLSTIDFCGEEIGRRAAETALQRIDKSRMDAPATAHVAPLVIARESTRLLS